MTEEQIELRVEKMFDTLDEQLGRGLVSQEEYDHRSKQIHEWAEKQTARADKPAGED
jgi:hypothetical protein